MELKEYLTIYKTYSLKKEELKNELAELEKHIESVKLKYIESAAQFKPGDKVLVKCKKKFPGKTFMSPSYYKDVEEVFYIKFVRAISDGSIYYGFLKSKKDGTPSAHKPDWANYDFSGMVITKI